MHESPQMKNTITLISKKNSLKLSTLYPLFSILHVYVIAVSIQLVIRGSRKPSAYFLDLRAIFKEILVSWFSLK